jgi:ketosteroid isomerase-like protein
LLLKILQELNYIRITKTLAHESFIAPKGVHWTIKNKFILMETLIFIIAYFITSLQAQGLPCGEREAFGSKAGDSKITLVFNNCTVLEERASSSTQNGVRYAGKSYSMYTAFNDSGKIRPTNFAPAAIADSILRGMEMGYNKGDYQKIASYYAQNGKVVGKNVEISGKENMLKYWKDITAMGGSWKLTNDKTEKISDAIWQKGVSLIVDKDGKQHQVSFTLVLIQENGLWKILQDAYW